MLLHAILLHRMVRRARQLPLPLSTSLMDSPCRKLPHTLPRTASRALLISSGPPLGPAVLIPPILTMRARRCSIERNDRDRPVVGALGRFRARRDAEHERIPGIFRGESRQRARYHCVLRSLPLGHHRGLRSLHLVYHCGLRSLPIVTHWR